MKPIFLLFLALASTSLYAQRDGDQLFDPAYLHEIRFESADPGFFDLLVSTWEDAFPNDVPYLAGNVRIDGHLIDSVGVRIKGGISAFDKKRPLKVDFNAFVSGQQYDGVKKFNLQNGNIDPSLQRDALGYAIFRRAGVKAPRAAFAKVFFNDVYHGVYTMVEQVDKNFLRNYFAGDEGTLYKSSSDCQPVVESGPLTFAPITEMNSIAATLSGNAFISALEPVLATDAFLRFFLIENFINAADNPIDVGCNFYLYHETRSGLLYWIPWDLNYTLHNGKNYPLLYESPENAVITKMLQTPVYRDRYLQLACRMLDYLFRDDSLHALIDRQAQLIRDAVMTDPRYPYSFDKFDLETTALKTLMTERRQRYLQDLAAIGYNCPASSAPVGFRGIVLNEFVASADSTGGIADPDGGHPDWIELYNTTNATVPLDGFYLSDDRDFRQHWPFPPGSSIAPGGYLIVWADRDVDETGLHADFQLDKDSGQIFLTFDNLALIDSVAYGPQTTNIASARVPNGTGDWVAQAPTFEANNQPSSGTGSTGEPAPELVLAPNPASRFFAVRMQGLTTQQPVQFRLLNILGETVSVQRSASGAAVFDAEGLAPGLYGLVAEWGQVRVLKKVVVEKR